MNLDSLFKKEQFWVWILLIYGFLIRILYIFCFTKPESYLWSDAGTYDNHAMRMANGTHILLSTYWPPFFHIFLSLIYRPLIWLGLEAQRVKIDVIIFGIFYTIGFWCIYQISKKLFSSKIAFIILVILTLWYPFTFLNSLVMSENLFFPLFFLGFYFLIKNTDKASTGIYVGIFWGIAAITRPIILLFLPVFVLWCLWYKLNWKLIANFLVTTAVVIGAMSAFNFYYTGSKEKFISSSGGFNFAMTWCDVKSVKYFTKDNYWYWFASAANIDYPDEKSISTKVPFENQNYYYQLGLNCIKEKPFQIVKNFYSIVKLFHSHLFPTLTDTPFWEGFRLLFKILNITALIGSIVTIVGIINNKIKFEKQNKKFLFLFALTILSLFVTIYLQNVGEERYMIPYAPILMMLSAPTFLLGFNKWKKLKKNKFEKRYWVAYFAFAVFSIFIFQLYSIKIEKAYFISAKGFEKEISMPNQDNDANQKDLNYKLIVNSNVYQNANVNIALDDVIDKISVNGRDLDLLVIKNKYNEDTLNRWERGYIFSIPLERGKNTVLISGRNTGWGYSLKFNQKPQFIFWMLLFITMGIPIAYAFVILIRIIYEKDSN